MTARSSTPLKFLYPGWYAIVMGLCGLSLAFHRAAPLMGELAGAVSWVIGALAALVFAVLAAATLLRAQRYPQAWAEDRRHPVRHTFIAALPIALLLLATVAVASGLHQGPARLAVAALWWLGSLAQLFVTAWVLARWWHGNQAGGLQWASATPALFIPIVGNVLAPLAGVPLGQDHWAAAQFGVGLLFWPVVMVLLTVRIALQGLWPERLLPATFIFIAPPAVVGLSALQLGAPALVAWALWGMALFSTAWCAALVRRIAAMPFGLPHWGMSFPLAAMAALTLRLVPPEGAGRTPMMLLGIALLALSALIVTALALATVRGLRDGSLLAPEPVATITAAPPPAA
ncbi:MAG: SLAC1 anion channel family protein [Rubrivivax sp.]|nr:SLAC1 anion channel family protein [Rubrivivax sp.]